MLFCKPKIECNINMNHSHYCLHCHNVSKALILFFKMMLCLALLFEIRFSHVPQNCLSVLSNAGL